MFRTAGDVLTLPEGATGVDFAFALNPDFLARLSGIRIDGEAREATYKLRNGDTVDLVLANGRERGAPRSLWASKAKTLEARTSLRRSLRHRSRRTRRELGADEWAANVIPRIREPGGEIAVRRERVHSRRLDMQAHLVIAGKEDRRMERAVAVRLGIRNVVLE